MRFSVLSLLGAFLAVTCMAQASQAQSFDAAIAQCDVQTKLLFEQHQDTFPRADTSFVVDLPANRALVGMSRAYFEEKGEYLPLKPQSNWIVEDGVKVLGKSFVKQKSPPFITWRFDKDEVPLAGRLVVYRYPEDFDYRVGMYMLRADCAWEYESWLSSKTLMLHLGLSSVERPSWQEYKGYPYIPPYDSNFDLIAGVDTTNAPHESSWRRYWRFVEHPEGTKVKIFIEGYTRERGRFPVVEKLVEPEEFFRRMCVTALCDD